MLSLRSFSHSLLKTKRNRFALLTLFIVSGLAVFSPWLAPYPFDQQHLEHLYESPSWSFWLGTDQLGRDLFSRLIYGARMSLAVGVSSAVLSLILGGVYGALSGWSGGKIDHLMMRVVDVFYSVPSLIVMILIQILLDSTMYLQNPELKALIGTTFALALVGWVGMARLVRGQVLQLKELSFIEAGRALGFRPWVLLKNHVLPNIAGPVIVLLTYKIPTNILYESFLSFLGLGLQPPYSSWGVLAADGANALETFPHLLIFPGLVLCLTMMAFQILGDSLRDSYDPKSENSNLLNS